MRNAFRWTIGGVLALTVLVGMADRAGADPLDPLDPRFPSLGPFPTAAGTYTISTSGPTPTLTGPGGTMLAGVVSGGIAVFDFDSFNLGGGATININPFTTALVVPTLPVALLSRSDETIAGKIDVNATSFSGPGMGQPGQFVSNPPEFGPGGAAGGGGGGGFGTPGSAGQTIPANLFGAFARGGAGGGSYGNLSQLLQMGSPGALGTLNGLAPGGGAIELGARGVLFISGSITADGAPGTFPGVGLGGGGGSGGAIYAHAFDAVEVTGQLSVQGGAGGPGGVIVKTAVGGGGAGGGGRILLQVVPEPASLVLLGIGLLAPMGAWGFRLGRARAAG